MRSVTKNALIISIVVVILLSIGVASISYLFYRHKSLENNIMTSSVAVATTVVDLQHGTDKEHSLMSSNRSKFLVSTISSQIQKYKLSLEARNNAKINISSLYKSKYSGVNTVLGGKENTPVVGYSGSSSSSNASSTSGMKNDSRIFYQNGVAYVYVKDLSFGSSGNDIVPYKGVNIVIDKSSVPETYTMMKNDPNKVYKYNTYVQGQDSTGHYIAVVYTSVLTGDQFVIRVYNNGKKITHFKVV